MTGLIHQNQKVNPSLKSEEEPKQKFTFKKNEIFLKRNTIYFRKQRPLVK
jgi:hypothetical protein